MAEEEVLTIRRKLAKYNADEQELDDDTILDLLKRLQDAGVTLDILQNTRIGMTVNELRKKCNNEQVSSLSKSLIKQWKKLLAGDAKQGGKAAAAALPRNESIASNLSDSQSQSAFEGSSQEQSSQSSVNGASVTSTARSSQESRQTSFPAVRSTDDEVRDKCRDMLLSALKSGDLPDHTGDPEAIACRVEEALFELYKMPSDKYKGAVRKRVFNLRDKKNPDLRFNVLTGVISASKFAKMTSEDMASPDVKSLREKFTKEAINDHQLSVQTGTATDMFKCGKCGKKNCTYTQVQTRSADEPMTTFVFCRECGNRWKFC